MNQLTFKDIEIQEKQATARAWATEKKKEMTFDFTYSTIVTPLAGARTAPPSLEEL